MSEPRIAIVTGGLQGIGLAIAETLTAQGMRVAVGSRRGAQETDAAAAKQAVGEGGLVAALDVASVASVEEFVAQTREQLGAPTILVNAAGVSIHHPVDGHPDKEWESVIDINLSGPFRMTRACLPDMKQANYGRIVNIASTAARVAQPTHPAYCASKTGLVGLTRAVAMEGGPFGITCIAISPTWVETDMLQSSARTLAKKSGRTYEEEIAAMAQSNPQGRLVQPSEIAALTAFCCSDAAAGLTMEDIQVNAGAWW